MQRGCSIFFYEGYVALAPTIINISKILDKCGYLVSLFATQHKEIPQPERIGTGVKIVDFPTPSKLYLLLNRPGLRIFGEILNLIIFCFRCFAELSQSHYKTEKLKSNINIGIDLHGSVIALISLFLLKQKFIFLSLELPAELPQKTKTVFKPFIEITKLAYRKSEAVIVQDEDRFKTLCKYYDYQHPKVFYLPNSPLNDFSHKANTENFFREKFSLSEEEFPYIVLYAGILHEVVYSKALAHAFNSIASEYVLIFHGVAPKGFKEEDPYIQSLRQLNSKNLYLSLQPLPYDQVDKIYASSTIGVAFYANQDDNYTKIAKASGKLAQYLKHGKPVLLSNLPSLNQLVEKYPFGIVIKNPSDAEEIKLAIAQIINYYDEYSKSARLCFEAEFNFEKHIEPILSFMDSLQADVI